MNERIQSILDDRKLRLTRFDNDIMPWDFDTGPLDDLDEWLRQKALHAQAEGLCTVWVLHKVKDSSDVIGYFSLSPHEILVTALEKQDRHFTNNHVARSMSGAYRSPTYLLGKFALSKEYQGKGFGLLLMALVYEKYVDACEIAGAKALILHTNEKKLINYYRRMYGFKLTVQSSDEKYKSMYKISASILEELDIIVQKLSESS